jgi:hypothetical protein
MIFVKKKKPRQKKECSLASLECKMHESITWWVLEGPLMVNTHAVQDQESKAAANLIDVQQTRTRNVELRQRLEKQ